MPLPSGTRVGPYEIVSPLGAGGMGEVYRARDTRLGRDVAIKVLPAAFASDPGRRQRFEQEARSASALNHPNILTIYDVGDTGGAFFVASELVTGETLRAGLDRGPLPVAHIEAVAQQIAAGLAAAHEAGIVHRDLKPENVMIRPDGLVKILDFGIAKIAAGPHEAAETIAGAPTGVGTIAGTIKYMSPEQARGLPVDARSDVFSFGVVLYEMLSGRVPHDGPTPTDVLVAILEHPPDALPDACAHVPPALRAILHRCLEKPRERRYLSGRELLEALTADRASTAGTAAVASRPSIAVLPFVNMSADPENEYFCDGLAEELIDRLTRIEQLRVAARGSAFAFKRQRTDVREIGRALNVSTVLDGSVRKAGPRIRITVQVVNVADGLNLWSEKYDRTLEDIFAIQDEIARCIADALKVTFTRRTHAVDDGRSSDNVEAYNEYLKGRFCRNKWTPEAFAEALAHYDHALQMQPSYALAAAGVAEIYGLMGVMGWLHPDTAWPKAKSAAQRALSLDATLAPAHTVLGGALWQYERDWVAAERAFQRAIQENAAYPVSYEWYGFFLMCLRRTEEAMRVLKTMRDLDPLSAMYNSLYGCGLWYARRYEDAIAHLKITLDMDPGLTLTHFMLGVSYERTDALDRAIEALERTCAMGMPVHAWLGHAYARAGRTVDAARILEELTTRATHTYVPAYEFALLHVGLGHHDLALDWLEKAVADRGAWTLHSAKALPHFEPLHGEPRFQEFVRRLGMSGGGLNGAGGILSSSSRIRLNPGEHPT